MGTNSGDGYYQEVDEARYGADDFERECDERALVNKLSAMQDRYYAAERAVTGTTIQCSYCARSIIKTTYHKRFCSPTDVPGQKKKKNGKSRHGCKDRYWNYVNPRGKFAHLG